MAGIDLELIRHALSVAQERGFAEVELASEGSTFTATLEVLPKKPKPAPKPVDAPAEATNGHVDSAVIKSPLVGYYREGDKPLKAGETVAKHDVVAVVNALGIANDVEAGVEGEILEVLVEDGQPVQYGQILARVKA